MPKDSQFTGIQIPAVNVGQLEIHGKRRMRTWTKLATTAEAGSTSILLSEEVDWKPGETIVLSGTQPESDFGIDEATVERNIDGYTIVLTQALQHTHTAQMPIIEGRQIDLRGAVGLITRNILIRGDNNSVGQQFGVQTVARYSGIFRIENVEIMHCGQAYILGRYCTHSHRAGNMEGSYVKANSIHHSFQRAVTTHDTFYWEVRDNVAYDVMGHTYFLEDGTEMYNTLSGNLGIRTRTSSALLSSDQEPAVFWTSSPVNFWYDNYGANSDAFGFWFELAALPNNFLIDGDFSVCPLYEPLGEFRNNTFIGNGGDGLRIYPGYLPLADPCGGGPTAPQYLYELITYHNGEGMFNKHIGDVHHINYAMIENFGHGMSILKFETFAFKDDPEIFGAIIVGTLNPNFDERNPGSGGNAIKLPQYEYYYVKNITVVNFGIAPAFSGCNQCDNGEEFAQGGFTTRFADIKFINTSRRIGWTPHYKEIFWDLDGTLIGEPDGMITYLYGFNNNSQCYTADVSIYDFSLICRNSTKIRRLAIDYYFSPRTLANNALTVLSEGGSDNIAFLPLDLYGWVMPVVDGFHYKIMWNTSLQSASAFNVIFSEGQYLNRTYYDGINESIVLSYSPYRFDYIAYDYTTTLYQTTTWASLNETVALNDRLGSSSFNSTEQVLDIVLSNLGANFNLPDDNVGQLSVLAKLCPPEGCPLPPKPTYTSYTLWSDPLTWTSIGGFPQEGQFFNISASQWVVLDINTPALGCIQIYGKLSVLSSSDRPLTLTAQCIQVYGIFEVDGRITPPGINSTSEDFNGTLNIVLHGSRDQVVPLVMGEGLFIGSKHIAVSGTFTARGRRRNFYQMPLATTAFAGSASISVVSSSPLDWEVGDAISISATAYFNSYGDLWSNATAPSNEKRIITGLSFSSVESSQILTVIDLDMPLLQTHVCLNVQGESFCSKVALLTRNVQILSQDITGANYGFGGHIAVVDIIRAGDVGQIDIQNVLLTNFGKINDQYYTLGINYQQQYSANLFSRIVDCVFVDSFNVGVYLNNAVNVSVVNNIIFNNFGGGIYVENTCDDIVVTNNQVLSTQQTPSIFVNGYAWTVPIAAYTLNSFTGIYTSNLASGSYDAGFSVATSVFSGYNGARANPRIQLLATIVGVDPCSQTFGAIKVVDVSSVVASSIFSSNEAVGCREGLMVVNDDIMESTSTTCAVVSGIKAWRNAHFGIGGVDAFANTLITNAVVAENHIGISFSYTRTDPLVFSGVANSLIIGSLSSSPCSVDALALGASWINQKCQVFSQNDPYGLSSACNSVLGTTDYTRVGVLIPQSTNAGKTCRVAGRFQTGSCNPSVYPDRLCALPWEKRYGLASGELYSEHHLFNNTFIGFSSSSTCMGTYGAAVAINPTQVDAQPTVVSSSLTWAGQNSGLMDIGARIGFELGDFVCGSGNCMGHHLLLVHDSQGFLLNTVDNILPDIASRNSVSGTLLFDNPEYVSSDLSCEPVPALGSRLYSCVQTPLQSITQYTGLWQDDQEASSTASTGPVVIESFGISPASEPRSYASYGPKFDPCPVILPTNRFVILITDGFYHNIRLTASLPNSWYIRWDAPLSTNAAILNIFTLDSYVIDVYTAPSESGPFSLIPQSPTVPNLDSVAGANLYYPQGRNLTVTVRGGTNRVYHFVVTPTIAVTITLDMSFAQFFSNTFVANVALLLGISLSQIKIADVRSGSVIVDFLLLPSIPSSNSTTMYNTTLGANSTVNVGNTIAQIEELQQIASNLSALGKEITLACPH